MNVRKLKQILAEMPDDMIVLIPAFESGYQRIDTVAAQHVVRESESRPEYYGEFADATIAGDTRSLRTVLVIR